MLVYLTKINQTVPLNICIDIFYSGRKPAVHVCHSKISSAADFNLFFGQEAEIGDISLVPL